ncbi:MAG: hypothetical protein IKF52_04255 [Clostridia bacterium]|nr:hypothetical protein [Clostridia bacterium]
MEDREEYYEKLKKKVKIYKIIIFIEIIIGITLIILTIYENENSTYIPPSGVNMSQQEKDMYNKPFEEYIDKTVKPSDVEKIIREVIDSNTRNVLSPGKFIQVTTDIRLNGKTDDGIYGIASYTDNNDTYVERINTKLEELRKTINSENKIEDNGFKSVEDNEIKTSEDNGNNLSKEKYKITADYNVGIIVSIHIDDIATKNEPPAMTMK